MIAPRWATIRTLALRWSVHSRAFSDPVVSRGRAADAPARPLDVARAGLKTAERALAADEREARQRELDEAPPVLSAEEQQLADQLEALEGALADLTAGEEKCQLEVYLVVPPPTRQRWIATLGHVEPGRLREELIGAAQGAGKWGDMDLRLVSKVQCPAPHDTCQGRLWHIQRVVPRIGVHVPRTEAAVQAAAASTASAASSVAGADPLVRQVVEKSLDRALNPPAATGTKELLENAATLVALGKDLGVIGAAAKQEDLVAKIAQAAPALQALVAMFRPVEDPAMKLLIAKAIEKAFEPSRTTGLGDTFKLLEFAADRFGGGGGDRHWLGEAKELLVGVLETDAARAAAAGIRDTGAAVLERVRTGGPVVPTAGRPPVVAPPSPLGQLQGELEAAAARSDEKYFPTFVQRIRTMFATGGGPETLDGIAAGRIGDDQALAIIAGAGIQTPPAVQRYLTWFMRWLRYQHRPPAGAPAPAPPAPASSSNGAAGGLGRCQNCGQRYQDCDAESLKLPCDRCGGTVAAVVEVSS